MRSKTLWGTWFVIKHPEMMVLPVNFTKLFLLNSKPHCHYPIKSFCLENWSFFKNKKLLSSLRKDKDKRVTGKLPPRRLSPTNPTSRLRFGSGAILWGWGRGGQSFRGQFSKYPNDQMLEANFSAYVDKRFRIKDQRFAVNGRYRKCFWYCWPTILINVQKIFGFEKTYYV